MNIHIYTATSYKSLLTRALVAMSCCLVNSMGVHQGLPRIEVTQADAGGGQVLVDGHATTQSYVQDMLPKSQTHSTKPVSALDRVFNRALEVERIEKKTCDSVKQDDERRSSLTNSTSESSLSNSSFSSMKPFRLPSLKLDTVSDGFSGTVSPTSSSNSLISSLPSISLVRSVGSDSLENSIYNYESIDSKGLESLYARLPRRMSKRELLEERLEAKKIQVHSGEAWLNLRKEALDALHSIKLWQDVHGTREQKKLARHIPALEGMIKQMVQNPRSINQDKIYEILMDITLACAPEKMEEYTEKQMAYLPRMSEASKEYYRNSIQKASEVVAKRQFLRQCASIMEENCARSDWKTSVVARYFIDARQGLTTQQRSKDTSTAKFDQLLITIRCRTIASEIKNSALDLREKTLKAELAQTMVERYGADIAYVENIDAEIEAMERALFCMNIPIPVTSF